METKTASAPPPRPRFGQLAEKRLHKTPATVSWDQGRWPNFSASELRCKCQPGDGGCSGEYFHDVAFLDALQRLRDLTGRALVITSGRRCTFRNRKVGGATKSQHLVVAVDIALAGHDAAQLARNAVACGFKGIGFGTTFLHLDMRPGARVGFHYPNGRVSWTDRFGFDPAPRFTSTGKL